MWQIRRITSDKNSTIGKLYCDNVPICYTLENKKKLIPEGTYRVEYSVSPAFTKKRGTTTYLPLLYNKNVPASRGIRTHAGNTYKDSAGCVLVGLDVNGMELKNSRIAEEFITHLAEMKSLTEITIVDCENLY